MGIFDEIKEVAGLGGSALGEQHAGALSAVMEYVNSPQVGGVAGLQRMFQKKRARRNRQLVGQQRPEPADLGRPTPERPSQ